MIPRVEALIDLDALAHNFAVIRALVGPHAGIMPMIKANAYGHGLVNVAAHLGEAASLGVACLGEASVLRNLGIRKPIMVMSGFCDEHELAAFEGLQLTAVIHNEEQVRQLELAQHDEPLSVWLKVDTGMHRLGVSPEQFQAMYQRLLNCAHVQKPFGLMTHLACADSDDAFSHEQIALFNAVTAGLSNPKSITNSAAIFNYKDAYHDLVRPGIMLYGISPFANKTGSELGLKPVMTLRSRLLVCKSIKRGATVGYGATFTAERDLVMGIVAIGYGDGYPRHVAPGTPVLVHGVACPIIGRVSMDMITVDLTGVNNPQMGDPVILWGPQLPVERIAKAAGTIAYELCCQLTGRVSRKGVCGD